MKLFEEFFDDIEQDELIDSSEDVFDENKEPEFNYIIYSYKFTVSDMPLLMARLSNILYIEYAFYKEDEDGNPVVYINLNKYYFVSFEKYMKFIYKFFKCFIGFNINITDKDNQPTVYDVRDLNLTYITMAYALYEEFTSFNNQIKDIASFYVDKCGLEYIALRYLQCAFYKDKLYIKIDDTVESLYNNIYKKILAHDFHVYLYDRSYFKDDLLFGIPETIINHLRSDILKTIKNFDITDFYKAAHFVRKNKYPVSEEFANQYGDNLIILNTDTEHYLVSIQKFPFFNKIYNLKDIGMNYVFGPLHNIKLSDYMDCFNMHNHQIFYITDISRLNGFLIAPSEELLRNYCFKDITKGD